MLIYIYTSDLTETRDICISNLPQLVDYLQNNEPGIWGSICEKELGYAVVDSTGKSPYQILRSEIFQSDLTNYDTLLIVEKIEGQALFTAALVATTFGISASGFAAAAIAFAANVIVAIGISMAIGAIVQMLSPTNTINSDPSSPDQAQKNYTFNGIPNIREQGGAVPMIFGECLFGGILISADLYTSTANLTFTGVTSISNAEADSTWHRVVVV